MTTTPASDTFDALAAAADRFLSEIAERTKRDQPAVHASIVGALDSGECCTHVNIKVLPGGIEIRATVNAISDGAEMLILDEVSGVAMGPAQ